MKNTIVLIICLCGFFSCLWAEEILVLKNGKKILISDTYEIKGQYVLFKTDKGELTQLPAKLVDFEKSKQVTEEREKALLAAAEAAKPKPVVKKDLTMAEIADFVEKNRPLNDVSPQKDIQIGDDGLQNYGKNHPPAENNQASFVPSPTSGGSPEAFNANRQQMGQRYQELKREISEIDKKIAQTEENINVYSTEAGYGTVTFKEDDKGNSQTIDEGSDPGNYYSLMEQAEKDLTELKQQKAAKETELKTLDKEARKAGVQDHKRFKAKEKKDKKAEKPKAEKQQAEEEENDY